MTYSLKGTGDDALFSIDSHTGAVTLTGNPDHETKSSYSFTVVATDAAGNSAEQAVSLNINDLDESSPTFTSGATATATAIDENSGSGQVVYTASATDTADTDDASDTSSGVTYSLKGTGDDALFSIDSHTGAVTLTGNPDHETKSSYSFTVVATDAAGNSAEQAVSLNINDLDESSPTFTSGATATATAIDENSGSGQVVYTASATDTADTDDASDTSSGVTYSLKGTGDDALFSIDSHTGAVTLTGNPDHETKSSYSFTVVATDAAGNTAEQAVSLNINDLDESSPTFTSGATATATAIDENSGSGQVVYTASATDTADTDDGSDTSSGVTYSLKGTGDDALFSIDSHTGAVTLTGNPDHETKSSYSFTVVATDAAGNSAEQAVSLNINDLDESSPTFTSGATATATAIDENSGSGQVVYTASATDTADTDDSSDTSSGVTYSLKGTGDDALFSIDSHTGAVTLTGNPDHETKSSYSFTVVATDAAGNTAEQAVSLNINDLDESSPVITSGATATAIDENSGSGQVVYTASATDTADTDDASDTSSGVTYSLKGTGDDALFSIDSHTGAVTLTGNPDHETKSSYTFTVVAKDAAGNSSEQAVSLNINDLDEVAPSFTSASSDNTDENQSVLYTAAASDNADISAGISYSLKSGIGDEALLSIDANSGAVSLASGNLDYESKPNYSFTVIADDGVNPPTEQSVTIGVNNLDEVAPSFTSASSANADENQSVLYTAAASDNADISAGISYSLKSGIGDEALLSIDASSGAVSLASGNLDYESKPNYSFTVIADDGVNPPTEQSVTIGVNNLDEVAPSFTSASSANADENQSVLYTAAASDNADISAGISYSLKSGIGDEALLSIDASSGAVSLASGNLDYESKPNYSFTVIADDGVNPPTEQSVTIGINDLDEIPPTVSSVAISGATGLQDNLLNAGDVVNVTVSLSEATTVTGTPQLALNIGGATVQADYVSGSGTNELVFQYTIQASQTDTDGISIDADSLSLNGGSLQDAAGNDATLTHTAVAANAGYGVDTTAPTTAVASPSSQTLLEATG